MHTLRLAVGGTVILALLAGLSGVVVAQDEGAPASDVPHKVAGTLEYSGSFASYTGSYASSNLTFEEGRSMQRDYGSYDTIEMDDARLSGTLWHVWNRDHYRSGEVLTGTVELVNDDGTWVGTMRGYKPYDRSGRRHYWQLELTGTGAYEGHSALLYTRGVSTYRQEVEGFVFPGALPEYPDPVEVPVR